MPAQNCSAMDVVDKWPHRRPCIARGVYQYTPPGSGVTFWVCSDHLLKLQGAK